METSQNDLIAHAITSLLDVLTINKNIHQYRDLIRLYARSARAKFQQKVEDDDFEDATPLDALCRYFDQPELLRDKFELLSANKVELIDEYMLTIWSIVQNSSFRAELTKQKVTFSSAFEVIRRAIEPVAQSLPTEIQTQAKMMQNSSDIELSWMKRPFMGSDPVSLNRAIPQQPISDEDSKMWRELPIEAQEDILMQELFYAMLGIEGKHIYLRENLSTGRFQFAVDSCVDPSTAALFQTNLPVCDAVLDINVFIQAFAEPNMGQVANAMSSVIAKLLSDWQATVTQFERVFLDGKLSLQNLFNNISRSASVMLLVRDVCMDAMNIAPRGARGGQLLNLVHERFQRTAFDQITLSCFVRIIQATSRPYWDMLRSWVYRGVIRDPHGEFLVEENKLMSGFSYSWEEKFKLRDDTDVPQFLQPIADKILVTGKYLDIIRECNIGEFSSSGSNQSSPSRASSSAPSSSAGESFDFLPFDRSYVDKIESAYADASSKLLTLLQSEYKLLDKLRSMKRFFLLDQSDFCSHFMDIAGEELRKKALFASSSGLQASLELALRSSSARNDPFGEDLLCGLHPRSLGSHIVALSANQLLPHLTLQSNKGSLPEDVQELFAFELFTLDYQPGWPLRLIFHERAMSKYQAIFRQLFYLRHVERALCQSWQTHQATKELFACRRNADDPDLKLIYRAYGLRQRMLHLVQTLQWYMTATVIEPQYALFEQELLRATTVEDLIYKHDKFLDSLLGQCMLRVEEVASINAEETQLPRVLIKLLTNCVLFANFTDAAMSKLMAPTAPTPSVEVKEPVKPAGKKGASQQPRASLLNKARMRASELAAKATLSKQGFDHTLGRFEYNFGRFVTVILKGVALKASSPDQDSASLSRILEELDVNDFYNKSLLGGEF